MKKKKLLENPEGVVSDALLSEVRHYMELCYAQKHIKSNSLQNNDSENNPTYTHRHSTDSDYLNASRDSLTSENVPTPHRVDYSWLATSNQKLEGGRASISSRRRSSAFSSARTSLNPEIGGPLDHLSNLSIINNISESAIDDPVQASELPYMTELENAELERLAFKVEPREYVKTVQLFRRNLARLIEQKTSKGNLPKTSQHDSNFVFPIKDWMKGDEHSSNSSSTHSNSSRSYNFDEQQQNIEGTSKNYANTSNVLSTTSFSTNNAIKTSDDTNKDEKTVNIMDLSCLKPREIPNVMRLSIYRILDMRDEKEQSHNKQRKKSSIPSLSQSSSVFLPMAGGGGSKDNRVFPSETRSLHVKNPKNGGHKSSISVISELGGALGNRKRISDTDLLNDDNTNQRDRRSTEYNLPV
ncbi:unnamed protein product [Gordionus sp. m RMFG-2023]